MNIATNQGVSEIFLIHMANSAEPRNSHGYRIVMLALLTLLAFAVVSCGGSGGNTATGILYRTNWFKTGTPGQITGASQRISIVDNAGIVISSLVLRDPTLINESASFTVTDGTYIVRSELYTSSSASGAVAGIVEVPVTVAGSQPIVQTYVGDTIANITVTPSSDSTPIDRGLQFRGNAVSSSGSLTFCQPNSFTWTVLGGIGTVLPNGNFTGTTVGTGSVRATYTPTGTNGSASVTVTPRETIRTGKWTVLVYINAANDLETYSIPNVNQMEKVAGNPDVRFVLQWKQSASLPYSATFDGTRRYLVKPDTTNSINSELVQDLGTGVDMGSPTTLHDFIQWGKTNYPADKYCLIVWNHGNGWRRSPSNLTRAVSYDDELGTSIQIWELNAALGSEHFDILAWDSSLMQMMEVAYQVRSNVDYVVGSEESPPAEGYPYDLVFAPFRDSPIASTLNLTKSFVDGMLAVPAYNNKKITQSVVDTSKLPALATAISNLGAQLTLNGSSLTTAIQQSRIFAKGYSTTSTRIYKDIINLCDQLDSRTTEAGVLNATAAVRTAYAQTIVWEGHNSNSVGSTGLSIDFSSGATITSSFADYQRMQFAIDTQWDEFLQTAP